MKDRKFTLIELLVALAIIAVLAGLVVYAVIDVPTGRLSAVTATRLEMMAIALDQYREERGAYPQAASAREIDWPVSAFMSTTGKPYLEGYDPARFKDGWGNRFWYQCPGTMNPEKFDLWSMGRDGAHGKKGVNDNTTSPTDDAADAPCTAADSSDDIANWKRHP
ncbi:MAG: hypothetical protein A3K19_16545 [Lentisphaerae bacterium RIFOXYB12_FULL_65_16]|nr:MAG: hypothetical protein A3K18_24655 [Lentisphaerae bacterium RIFOXYA12_64_32]OGV89052.1 MAG: hypothetical protein A3K19_16545 [Lentisphaerae bacterium RIFOXYB12_FULL_65_16]